MIKRVLITALLCIAMVVPLCVGALAVTFDITGAPQITSGNLVVIMSVQNGQILFNTANGKSVDPTCAAKLMSAMIIYDKLSSLDDNVTVDARALQGIGANGDISAPKIGISAGNTFRAKQLLQATLISAANDACNALAFHVSGGDIPAFVAEMNKRAAALGCTDTLFTNTTGLYDGNAYTTVEDVALIASAFYKYNTLLDISSQATYVLGGSTIHTKNYLRSESLLGSYIIPDSLGMIAGQRTQKDDYCLITAAESDGIGYVYVVMEAPGEIRNTDGTREFPQNNAYTDIKLLFDWAKNAFGYVTLVGENEIVGELPVDIAAENVDHINYVTQHSVELLLPKDITVADIERKVTITAEQLTAPVEKNMVVGYLELYYQGSLLETVPLITNSKIEKSELLELFATVRSFLFGSTMKTVYKIIVIIIVLYILLVLGIRIYKITGATVKFTKKQLDKSKQLENKNKKVQK